MNYKDLIAKLQKMKDGQPDGDILDEAMDIIADYEQVTLQLSIMLQKYETVKNAISRGMGVYQCPDCGGMVYYGNEHCRNCGRRIGWVTGSRKTENVKKGGKKRCRK